MLEAGMRKKRIGNFGILYRYEMKKLIKRKIVWIAFAVTLILSLLSICSDVMGNYYVDGILFDTHYHMMETDREYARALNGRAIDQELIEEMQAAYRMIPTDELRYSTTDEYQTYARPYSDIFQIVRKVMHFSGWEEMCAWEADEAAFYDAFVENIEEMCEDNFLTKNESEFWIENVQSLEKPLVYGYAKGYWKLISSSYTVCFLILIYSAVCLSDFFTKEHMLRTDQLLLSSRLGRKQTYWAKAAAGISFTAISIVGIGIVMVLTAFGIYGADGADVMIQTAIGSYPLRLSAGRCVILVFCLMVLTVLFMGTFVMMLSELIQNGIAALTVACSVILIPLFTTIPPQYRVLARVWDYLPGSLLDVNTFFGLRTIPLFGTCFTVWQSAPVIYVLLGGAFLYAGMRAYQKYQVGGR